MTRTTHLALLALVAAPGGCGAPEVAEDKPGLLAQSLVEDNGVQLNGTKLNGVRLNGVRLNGVRLNGTALAGVTLKSVGVSSVTLDRTVFSGQRNSTPVHGMDFVGATFQGTLSDGTALPVTVQSIAPAPAPNADLLTYVLSYQTTTGIDYLCGTDASGAPIAAMPFSGTFDYGQGSLTGGSFTASTSSITFSCVNAAVAKCALWGYRPWLTMPNDPTSLMQGLWMSCTRMVRADYCGDGNPHTANGMPIDVYDGAGVLGAATAWNVEAEWTPGGARRVTPSARTRWILNTLPQPACWSTLVTPLCGKVLPAGSVVYERFN